MEERPARRLACRSCQRRKIKCDREVPCQTCVRNGLQCIPVIDQRVARGKNGGRRKTDDVLGARLEKLEALLSSLQAQGQKTEGTDGTTGSNTKTGSANAGSNDSTTGETAARSQYQYLGSAFWSSLKDKLDQIQDAYDTQTSSNTPPMDDLQDDDSEFEELGESPATLIDIATGTFVSSILLQAPPPVLKRELCAIFFTNVDPVFKVLHAPSVRAHMEQGAFYLGHGGDNTAVAALMFVIYYAAVNTMSEDQCVAIIGQQKAQALRQYRLMAEAALTQAEYIVSPDVTTLQAFVIYLAMLRHEDRSRRCWTLLALAVRIALALGLHSDKHSHDAFATEQRRRLWHQIRVLDLQVSVDLASDSLILPGMYSTPPPSNVNDIDLVPGCHEIVPRHGFTDMTFSLITQFVAERAVRAHTTQSGDWQKRQEIILSMDQELQYRYLVHCDCSIPFHAFTMAVTKSTVKACLLHAICPTLAANASNNSAPPINSDYVLSLAVDVLTSSQDCTRNQLTEAWRWTLWVQWHALAVAFAALAFITTGVLAERAWVVTEMALSDFLTVTARGQQAQLRRPLEKLALKARRARAASTFTGSTNTVPITIHMDTQQDSMNQQYLINDQVTTTLSMERVGLDLSMPALQDSLDGFVIPDGFWGDFLENFPDTINPSMS